MSVDVVVAGSGGRSVVSVGEGDAWRPEALGAPSKVDSLIGLCPWSTPPSAMLSPASLSLSLFLSFFFFFEIQSPLHRATCP